MDKNTVIAALVGIPVFIGGVAFTLTLQQPPVPEPPVPQIPAPIPINKAGPDFIYPDVPGVIDPDTTNEPQNTICNSSWSTNSIRPPVSVTDPIKTTALVRYNQENNTTYTKADGELDHLISLELGGAPADPDNLWFEPYTTVIAGKQVGAHEKDKVENELHKEVCAGTISLSDAQHIITTDWYAFYLSHNL